MLSRVLLLMVFLSLPVLANLGLPMEDLGEMIQHKNNLKNKPQTEEESLEAIQAYILKEMFFDPILNDSDALSEILDDDEDEDENLGLSSGMDMYKGLLSEEVAKRFKGKDILGLKRRYLNRGELLP